jgi:hypothetical protein
MVSDSIYPNYILALNPPPLQTLSDLRPYRHHNPQPPKKNERAKIPNSKISIILLFLFILLLFLIIEAHSTTSTSINNIIETTI